MKTWSVIGSLSMVGGCVVLCVVGLFVYRRRVKKDDNQELQEVAIDKRDGKYDVDREGARSLKIKIKNAVSMISI